MCESDDLVCAVEYIKIALEMNLRSVRMKAYDFLRNNKHFVEECDTAIYYACKGEKYAALHRLAIAKGFCDGVSEFFDSEEDKKDCYEIYKAIAITVRRCLKGMKK